MKASRNAWIAVLGLLTISGLVQGQAAPTTQPVRAVVKPGTTFAMPESIIVGWRNGNGLAVGEAIAAAQVAQQYSCVLRLDGGPDAERVVRRSFGYAYAGSSGNSDVATAIALLTSTALVDSAAAKALKFGAEQRRDLVSVIAEPAGDRTITVEISLGKSPDAHYAHEAAVCMGTALVANLKAAFKQSAAAARQAAAADRPTVEKQLAAAREKSEGIRRKEREVRDATSAVVNNAFGDFHFTLNNLRVQKKNYESELARNKSRLAQLEPDVRPLVKEWTEIVKLRVQHVAELKKQSPENSSDIADAEVKVADAKAQLAKATQENIPEPETVMRYRTNEPATLRANIADEEARLKEANEQIAKLEDPKFAALADELPQFQSQQQALQARISELTSRLDALNQAAEDEFPVMITVLDGQAR